MNQFPVAQLDSRSAGAVARGQTDEKKKAGPDGSRYSHVEEACGQKNAGSKNCAQLEADRGRNATKSL
jgi:hypothetical protein